MIRLVNAQVLIEEAPVTTKYGSLEIPDEYKKVPNEGTVVAVGKWPEDSLLTSLSSETEAPVKVGDRIRHMGAYADPIEMDGKKYRLVDIARIVGVLE